MMLSHHDPFDFLIGQVFETWGRDATARQSYLNALAVGEEVKDYSLKSGAINNLASLDYKQGKYRSAIKLYRKSLQILDE